MVVLGITIMNIEKEFELKFDSYFVELSDLFVSNYVFLFHNYWHYIMIEEEIENLSELTGEEFYDSIEKEYGENVEKILRYHDIDCCNILARVEERAIIGVFEEPNSEHTSDELTTLKKDLCNFIDGKMSLKFGTKEKTITLLRATRDYYRKRKVQTASEKKSINKSQSSSSVIDGTENSESSSTELLTTVKRSIAILFATLKDTIHGTFVENASPNDIKIDIQCAPDDALPMCYVQCICGYRIRLYYRGNGFQTSNLLKHFKLNKPQYMTSDKKNRSNNQSTISKERSSCDENSDEEIAPTFVDNIQNGYSSIDNNRVALSTGETNEEM